jgi:hypothetical protein
MNLPNDLQSIVQAFERGEITREQATERVKAWPAYLPCDMAAKARALRAIATAPASAREGKSDQSATLHFDDGTREREGGAIPFLPGRRPRPHALLRNQKP